MFSGVTRCRKASSCSFRFCVSQWKLRGERSGGHKWNRYSSSSSSTFFHRLFRWRPVTAMIAATAFSFKENGIPKDKVRAVTGNEDYDESRLLKEGWEMLYEESNLHVYRRKKEGYKYETFEYRCQGSYTDISPRDFLAVQTDVSYRSEWDKNVIKLELVEDDGSNEQVVRWVVRYPYPLYPREYVYVRRTVVSDDGLSLVIQSEAVPESVIPLSGNYVRIASYESRMCVRCHRDFETQGLDYVLTYFDNPEANIPSYAYNWIVNQAGPYFIKQVYSEARKLAQCGRHVRPLIRTGPPSAPAPQSDYEDEDDDEGVGARVDADSRSRKRKPACAEEIPGCRLIPREEDEAAPLRRGAERKGELGDEKKEQKKEEEEEVWTLDEVLVSSPVPGSRVFWRSSG